MKKVYNIFFILVLCGFFPVSCTKCFINYLGKYEFDVKSVDYTKAYYYNDSSNMKYIEGTTVDTLVDVRNNNQLYFAFNINSQISKLANLERNFSFQLFNTCNAGGEKQFCYDTAFFTLKNKIDSIVFTCDTIFNGKMPGTQLDTSDYFLSFYNDKIQYNYLDNYNPPSTFNDFVKVSNDSLPYIIYKGAILDNLTTRIGIVIRRKDNSNNLKFRLKIFLNNGMRMEAVTKTTYIIE